MKMIEMIEMTDQWLTSDWPWLSQLRLQPSRPPGRCWNWCPSKTPATSSVESRWSRWSRCIPLHPHLVAHGVDGVDGVEAIQRALGLSIHISYPWNLLNLWQKKNEDEETCIISRDTMSTSLYSLCGWNCPIILFEIPFLAFSSPQL